MRRATLAMIHKCNEIIEDFQAQGYTLTLRQLYYQIVGHDLFPDDRKWRWTGAKWVRDANGTKNAQPNYKFLGDIMNNARLAGLVDWDAIEDRTRSLRGVSHWEKPSDVIKSAANSFRIDKWASKWGQRHRIEVWVEKDALAGILDKACRPLDVDYFSCRGFTSQSAVYGAGKRLAYYIEQGQEPVIIHLGDHDPSGVDMTRDIIARLEMFVGQPIEVKRVALNMDQIRHYNPPPNPAKKTDSRYDSYRRTHGDDSWELDALDPAVIDNLITDQVLACRDEEAWAKALAHEDEQRALLSIVSGRWGDVSGLLVNDEIPALLRERLSEEMTPGIREKLTPEIREMVTEEIFDTLLPAPEHQYGEYY